MKRSLAVLLLFAFFLPVCVWAESASGTVDLQDFTLEMDPGAPSQTGRKAEGAVLFQAFPAFVSGGDEFTRLSVSWTAREVQLDGLTQLAMAMYGTDALDGFMQSMAALNITVESANVTSIAAAQVGGRQALSFDVVATVSGGIFGSAEKTVYQRTYLVPYDGGSYLFTGLTADQASLGSVIAPLIATVRWR